MGSLRHFGPDDLPEPPSIREAFRFAHSEETGCFATAHFGAVATNTNVEGKTTMLEELARATGQSGGCGALLVFAPSSSAVKVLKQQGFVACDTVQRLMSNTLLQSTVRGRYILVDEAGFLSAKQMRWMVKFSKDNRCRLILSGDSRQHHAVERGSAPGP